MKILVEGYYIERFINLCSKKQILLWGLERKDNITLIADINKKDFKNLRDIARKTKCKVKIKNKIGLPFVIRKYKKRKIFFILLILIFLIIFSLSHFIWNIEVESNTDIAKGEIISLAEQEGLKIGALKNNVDTKNVINRIRLERDDIAWVGIEIKGTNAIIKIEKADAKPEIVDDDDYCNIVADKEGVITKISAGNGTPLVKEGDVVKKGDVLIAGYMEGKYTGKQYVHSIGNVQAKVWHKNTQKVYFKESKKEETGNIETKYSVKINNFQINFNKSVPKFKKYDTIETTEKLKLFSNFYLPIQIVKYEYKEYNEMPVIHSVEESKQIGIERAQEELKKEIENKEITDKKINVRTDKDYIEVELIYEVKEQIGIEEKIVF